MISKRTVFIITLLMIGLVSQVVAQDESELFVTVTRIDSQNFPQMAAYVTVVDSLGLPVRRMKPDDFRVVEDGQFANVKDLKVSADDSSELRLVIGLDLSMPAAEVTAMQDGLLAFIDTLRDTDEISFVTFNDEVGPFQPFTSNKTELTTFVNNLAPEGNYTKLHETVYAGTNEVGQLPLGRRAVIVITNSGNNINSLYTAEETIANARDQKVPLYIIGLQNLNRLTNFQSVAAQTGGQSFNINSGTEVEATLTEIETLLRPGYKLTYLSELVPDNQEHTAGIAVELPGQSGATVPQSGSASSAFTAVVNDLIVTIAGISEGQTVTGLVNLTANVEPADGVTVEYFVDGQTIGNARQTPFEVEWNANLQEPGQRVISATAINRTGNEGTDSRTVMVAKPLAVTVDTDPNNKATVGDDVLIEAQVVALAEVKQVEFFANDEQIGKTTRRPYQITYKTKSLASGNYTIKARATDTLGAIGEAEIKLTLVAASPTAEPTTVSTTVSWWQWFLNLIRAPYPLWAWLFCLSSLLLLTFFLFIAILAQAQRKKGRKQAQIEVTNLGNISSRYEVRAGDSENELAFEFRLNQQRLAERQVATGSIGVAPIYGAPRQTGGSQPVTGTANGTPAPQGAAMQSPGQVGGPSMPAMPQNIPGSGAASGAMEDPKGTLKKAGALAKMAGPVGEILNAVSYVFPSFLAQPLRNIANTMRRADMAARRVERSQEKLDKLQQQTGVSMPGMEGGGGTAGQAGGGAGQAPARPQAAVGAPAPPGGMGQRGGGRPPSPGGAGQRGGMSMPSVSGGNFKEKAKQAMGLAKMAGPVGDVLNAISYVLPSTFAQPLRTLANTLKRAEMASRRVESSQKKLDKLQQESGDVVGDMGFGGGDDQQPQQPQTPPNQQAPGQPTPPRQPPSMGQPVPASQPTGMAAQPAPVERAAPLNPNSLTPEGTVENWAETPYIKPSESLMVDMVITALHPYRTKRYNFTVTTRSVEQEEAPIVAEAGEIEIQNVLAPQRVFIPTFLFVVIAFTAVCFSSIILTFLGILQM